MKILLVDIDFTLMGGIVRVMTNLANELSLKHKVDILSIYKENEKIFNTNKNINIYFLFNEAYLNHKQYKSKNIFDYIYFKFFKKIIIDLKLKKISSKYDIVIFNNYYLYNDFLKNKNTKYIKFIHSNFEFLSKKYLKKISYFDDLIILSNKQINKWQKYHKNIHVIPNFLPFISEKISDHKQKNILSIGRMTLNDEKGFLRLIEIWKLIANNEKYKDWTLSIVGEGELKNTIEEKIKENNLENSIILKPFTKDIEKEYLNASIYVMCSHFEGFGMVLVESANYGLPSIAFDINTGPSDIIENEKSGFLIQDNDLNEFANKLCVLMDDENLRKTMGLNAKKIVKNNFSKEVIMKKWEEVLNS
ncbi:glycosyltransferase family 4 protein [Campylobacter lari]|uniref:glycosyltransferase family 4 protein n=1 Tax=Campylobacter lari TaxID=201 RepID=UPI0021E650F6|nr:glycosyltransferase family 4 protein [Campylobacter lari]